MAYTVEYLLVNNMKPWIQSPVPEKKEGKEMERSKEGRKKGKKKISQLLK
jgi:hypothetical protein